MAGSLGLLVFLVFVCAQTAGQKTPQSTISERQSNKTSEADSEDLERRSFAISIVTSLAEEASRYQDEGLRARILSRAADAVWVGDHDLARSLFRRAWEAAEKRDADKSANNENLPSMAIALRRSSGRDIRAEVLFLAARRDRALAEEFFSKLATQAKREAEEAKQNPAVEVGNDGWSDSDASIKRLLIARRLLAQGEVEQAVEIAGPALETVNANSIGFLAALRISRPNLADQKFALLLSHAELDPRSDANTASGLSSYVFTPNLYVTFSADGGARWSTLDASDTPIKPPILPPLLVDKYLRTAATILLRPSPPPEHDLSSSGRSGKYMVMRRLLPLFDQYSPQTAAALRAQITELANAASTKPLRDDHYLLTEGLKTESPGDLFERMQRQLDHAKTSRERDAIYADAAVALVSRNDARAQELADKIDDATRRVNVRRYVDLQLIKIAVKNKQAVQVLRLAKAEHLTHMHRAWVYIEVSRLLLDSDKPYSLSVLEDAGNEARRLETSDPDRARSLVAVGTRFLRVDRVRAWEIVSEAIKAINAATDFNEENTEFRFDLLTMGGPKSVSFGDSNFSLSRSFALFAKDDLDRSLDLAKSLKKDMPRATATLAIARSILEK